MPRLPTETRWIIVGGGFAGAATAWALGGAGCGPGVILEQEIACGTHASGRNAALARLFEPDPVIGALARRSIPRIRGFECPEGPLIRPVGGLTLAGPHGAAAVVTEHDAMREHGLAVRLLSPAQARAQFPFLDALEFEIALWCGDDGVADIHALLSFYLTSARRSGFTIHTGCRVDALLTEGGCVKGVHTNVGTVRADCVIDAGGPWAGRLGEGVAPLSLQPLRRHLFVSAPTGHVPVEAPIVWMEDAAFYFRPDSGGLLLSPCDETPASPGTPSVDPAAAELLAEKISRYAPGLADLAIRRSWACLRTFAPDRHPLIGADPRLPGLFYVAGLGGVGMMCSAAVGELVADLLTGKSPDWIDPTTVAFRTP
jgi:D-arginine dehydrogenase